MQYQINEASNHDPRVEMAQMRRQIGINDEDIDVSPKEYIYL